MKPYKRLFKEKIDYDKYVEIADYISRNTASNKNKVIEWLKNNYNDKEVLDLPPVFGKYVSWTNFIKYFLNDKRIPTLKQFKNKDFSSEDLKFFKRAGIKIKG